MKTLTSVAGSNGKGLSVQLSPPSVETKSDAVRSIPNPRVPDTYRRDGSLGATSIVVTVTVGSIAAPRWVQSAPSSAVCQTRLSSEAIAPASPKTYDELRASTVSGASGRTARSTIDSPASGPPVQPKLQPRSGAPLEAPRDTSRPSTRPTTRPSFAVSATDGSSTETLGTPRALSQSQRHVVPSSREIRRPYVARTTIEIGVGGVRREDDLRRRGVPPVAGRLRRRQRRGCAERRGDPPRDTHPSG